ncbi:SemiSWEET family [Fructobacillus tropaeoli]|uniref:Membrane protein n=3 Tax=Fructobacillus TaxID=559173 RepID=A0A3F3GYN4_9LACO|nr:membrane protein [Fructobacillus tropaeoli]CAK1238338.1 SemiSWEET family [Fructobacillus tropaeoli]
MGMRVDNYVSPEEKKQVDEKRIKMLKIFSKVATVMNILMYVSYFPQIVSNFSGNPVNWLQPAVAMVNATLWTGYGWLKTYKDWPIIISNVPGIFFGAITFITVFIH